LREISLVVINHSRDFGSQNAFTGRGEGGSSYQGIPGRDVGGETMRNEKDRFNPREWDEIYFAFIESRVGALFSRGAH
jgi:hypothetical protein